MTSDNASVTASNPESSLPEVLTFADCADLLYGVVDGLVDSDYRFKVTWKDGVSPQPIDVELLDLEATGARRLETKRAVFSQAQFRLSRRSVLRGAVSKEFIWCSTKPSTWDIEVEPDIQALAADFDFRPLNYGVVTAILASRSSGIDDQIELVSRMGERDVPIADDISRTLSLQVYRSINELLGKALDDEAYRSKLFLLMRVVANADPRTAVRLQGQLALRLVKTIVRAETGKQKTESDETQDLAFATIENAFERGVLPHTRNVLDKILSQSRVFRSDYMTELLFGEMQSARYSDANKNIYGIKRESFAHDFIVETIVGRLKKSKGKNSRYTGIKQFVEKNRIGMQHVVSPISFQGFFAMAQELGVEIPETPSGNTELSTDRGDIADFEIVGQVYEQVLATLRQLNPHTSSEQELLDSHCVEILRRATFPYQIDRIMKRIFKANVKTDENIKGDAGETLA